MTQTSLSFLDQLCHRPDDAAWRQFVDLYTPLLHAWLRRYDVLQPCDADDLVQEVLLAVADELPRFEHSKRPGAFRNWLRTILVNRLRYFWRTRQSGPKAVGGSDFQSQLDALADSSSQISQMWDREHDRQVVQQLLQLARPRFTDITWQAFQRQVLDGESAATVAAELNMPMHSVYAAKSRVLSTLRQQADGLVG